MQRKDRTERDRFMRDIRRRPEAVEGDPCADQVEIGLGKADDACAVLGMPERNPVSQFLLNPVGKIRKRPDLCAGMRKIRLISP